VSPIDSALTHLPMLSILFSSNDPATPYIYTLSLHDALPICITRRAMRRAAAMSFQNPYIVLSRPNAMRCYDTPIEYPKPLKRLRSEEHTSELQSPYDLVCRLLLEKKKHITYNALTPTK